MLAAVPNTEWTATSVARVYSDPFGGIRGNTDADVPGDHRFLGATRDADSGLTLLGARYYDPVTGCFISVDPILNLEVPAHLHAYAYGFNNPVTFSDASGLEPRDKNGNFDGDPYSSPSTTSWAYLNGCGGNLSCVGTWVGNFQLNFYGGLAEGVGGLLLFACSSLCMVPMSINSAVTAFSDWDAHLASEQAKGEQFREWWSDPWNNFWRPIGEDWANDPGHAWSGTVVTAGTLLVPGGGLIKLGSAGTKLGAVATEGITLNLFYKEGWTLAQIAAADAKIAALNNAAPLVVTKVTRGGTSASSRYSSAGGEIPNGSDVDHTIDLQLGGAEDISNLSPLDASVNRSLGAQIAAQLRGLEPGTVICNVTICSR